MKGTQRSRIDFLVVLVLFIMLHGIALTFEFVDEILNCDTEEPWRQIFGERADNNLLWLILISSRQLVTALLRSGWWSASAGNRPVISLPSL